jgi:hypothetical protein
MPSEEKPLPPKEKSAGKTETPADAKTGKTATSREKAETMPEKGKAGAGATAEGEAGATAESKTSGKEGTSAKLKSEQVTEVKTYFT